jgi:hypothetical protein
MHQELDVNIEGIDVVLTAKNRNAAKGISRG